MRLAVQNATSALTTTKRLSQRILYRQRFVFKLIHCTETRSFDESPPPPFSNERGAASAAAPHIVVGPSPPEARAQNSNDSTRQLIDLRNAVTAKTTNFCSVQTR